MSVAAPDGGYQEEAGDRGRRRLWEDLPPHRVQQRPVPRGVRSHRVWELRGRHRGGRQTGGQSCMFGCFFFLGSLFFFPPGLYIRKVYKRESIYKQSVKGTPHSPKASRERVKTFWRCLRDFSKCRCFHYLFFISIFRFSAILGGMKTQLEIHTFDKWNTNPSTFWWPASSLTYLGGHNIIHVKHPQYLTDQIGCFWCFWSLLYSLTFVALHSFFFCTTLK